METKNNNKSLSARIKRRNKQSFRGIGNHSLTPKEVYLPINNELINHTWKERKANAEQSNLINYGKKHGFKHCGSKPLRILRHYI